MAAAERNQFRSAGGGEGRKEEIQNGFDGKCPNFLGLPAVFGLSVMTPSVFNKH